ALLGGLKAGERDYNIERALCHGVEGIAGMNTTLGCVVTNAKLTKTQCNVLASSTNDAYARCIRPVHTVVDGDCIFVLTSGEVECNLLAMQSLANVAMCKAIKNAFTLQ
ncbi:MAG: P1 family peptidase, partial [Clostridia bacterium]|nr:P1 family peptidase [Clostridia bacterium]